MKLWRHQDERIEQSGMQDGGKTKHSYYEVTMIYCAWVALEWYQWSAIQVEISWNCKFLVDYWRD